MNGVKAVFSLEQYSISHHSAAKEEGYVSKAHYGGLRFKTDDPEEVKGSLWRVSCIGETHKR